ncbi:MAG: hypothetical protein IOC90_01825 [Methylocystis sp.]|nr:hypothetical protein [Methylocystis sp.]MCA3584874.1 hypothetical protein [Methylocystis sp.]MCA3586765.1 hypothetical protein [Methylocystis sp.]MCA3591092.1 hypothetical protein [Methylocystis sp.]
MFSNLCLFAHFDQDDVLADYVLHYLEAIRAAGFDIVVISTSNLSDADVARLRTVAQDVILRENKGHDFASWGLGIERYGDLVSGRLLLTNDSVYGPIGDLGEALARLTSVPADVYGMIESQEIAPHLQSWFLLFEQQVHRSKAFRAIFAQDFAKMAKADVIRNGEVGLSQSLAAQGFRMRSLFSGRFGNGEAMRITSNASHFLWRELIEQENIPFLKIELLRVNPLQIGRLAAWKELVNARSPVLAPMIEAHLARTTRGRGPSIAELHNLPPPRRALQHFISRDYAYASAGRAFAARGNLCLLRLRQIGGAIVRGG